VRPAFAALLFFLLLLTATAGAQVPVGSQELQPAPGWRGELKAASSRDQHLLVWTDMRTPVDYARQLLAARLDAEGRVLDPAGIVLLPNAFVSAAPLVASDGEDWLVVLSDRTIRVHADGTTTSSPAFHPGYLGTLTWNGSAYLLTIDTTYEGSHGLLLDRDGRPVSGTLRLDAHRTGSVAAHAGRWLVASEEGVRLLTAADFPAIGATAAAPPPRVTFRESVTVASDAIGFLSLRHLLNDTIVQRHGIDGTAVLRPIVYRFVDGRGTVQAWNGALYVGSSSLERLSRGQAETLLDGAGGARGEFRLLVTQRGAIAVWRETRGRSTQLYSAPVDRLAQTLLVTYGRPRQMQPRIVSAASAHLAAWTEQGSEGMRVTAALVDDHGRALSAPLALGAPAVQVWNVVAATDGAGFLVAWHEGRDYQGMKRAAIVSLSGEAVQAVELPMPGELTSAVWDGTAYVLGVDDGAVRVTAGGVVLDPIARTVAGDRRVAVLFAGDGQALHAVARDFRSSTCSAVFCVWFEYSFLRLDGALQATSRSEVAFVSYLEMPLATVAAGGGRTFAVGKEMNGDYVVANDAGAVQRFDYGLRTVARRLHAAWNGRVLLVAAGGLLAEHDADGTLLRKRDVMPRSEETAIALDARGGTLLLSEELDEWGVPRLWLRRVGDAESSATPPAPDSIRSDSPRVRTASGESARATR